MIKDYWIYQKRGVPTPWALYVVKEFDKRYYKETLTLDYTFYHEDVPTPTHSVSFVGLHYPNVRGYVDEIILTISDYCEVTSEDYQQLLRAIGEIVS